MENKYEITNFETLETKVVSHDKYIKHEIYKGQSFFTPQEICRQVDNWVSAGCLWSMEMAQFSIRKIA